MKKVILILCAIFFNKSGCYIFSIIISIYNTGRYLDDSIGSLLNQTIGFHHIQLILVNDGSTDNSENICLKYKTKYKENIIYINTSHSGVSIARNIGLKYATGLYVNFLDSDDKWEPESLKNVYLFYKMYKNIDIIAGRIKYFESMNSYHFLDYKFKRTRVINLNKDYDCIQLSAASSFFRFSSIRGKKFDEHVFSGEDIRFISNYLLIKPIIGLVKEAIYLYRKRSDSSSAMQTSENKKDFYFMTINLVQQYLIDQSNLLYNKILSFIQFYIAYETLFRIAALTYRFLNHDSYKKYCSIIENLINQIEDKYFLEQKIFPSKLKIYALSKKYKKDLRYDITLSNNCFLYFNYVLINLKIYNNIISWKTLHIENNLLHLEGEDRFWLPRDEYYYFCKLGNNIFFPKYYYHSLFDFNTLYGCAIKGRIIYFDIILDINVKENILFYLSYRGTILEISTSLDLKSHLPHIEKSYYIHEKYILKNNNHKLTIYNYDSNLVKLFELEYRKELKKLKKDYLIDLRKNNINNRKKRKSINSKQIWLINDRKDQALDNGEYLFRYLNILQPKNIVFFFIIEKNCSDYKRLKLFDNIIDLNSKQYINLFFKADKIISSSSINLVNYVLGKDCKYMIDLYYFDFIYLKNGIIKDDLSIYLNKITTNFDLIITSSIKEYKYFLNNKYGYNKNNIVLTGLPRFDNLLNIQQEVEKEKIIIIFPTWRSYIKGTIDLITKQNIKSESFINTTYFKFYNNLINNKQLMHIMKKNDYEGIFCLHPNFVAQKNFFTQNNIFKIKEKCNDQKLFAKSSLLVTDYSSIFFDFGYIKKAIIYTQFDFEEYRSKQFQQGYFDYKSHGFGKICYDIQCTINLIISEIENNCVLKNLYNNRIKRFFKYHDNNNCYRVFKELTRTKSKKYEIKQNK